MNNVLQMNEYLLKAQDDYEKKRYDEMYLAGLAAVVSGKIDKESIFSAIVQNIAANMDEQQTLYGELTPVALKEEELHEWVEKISQMTPSYAMICMQDLIKNREEYDFPEETHIPIEPPKSPIVENEAFRGIAGEYINLIENYTEADPIGILVNILTAFGNIVGTNPVLKLGVGVEVYPRLFSVLVGDSAKSRKGTTWSDTEPLFETAQPDWLQSRVHSKGGLSSGEGLLHAVRDPRYEMRETTDKHTKEKIETEELVDSGVEDKRLTIIEPEFSSVLQVAKREGNTLSEFIRKAYDLKKGEKWSSLVKHNKDTATGAHISLIGHITKTELKTKMNSVELANGFANRFMWFGIKRSKLIPIPKERAHLENGISEIGKRLAGIIEFASQPRVMSFSPDAEKIWADVYCELAKEDENGILDSLMSRADSNTLRVAMIYALMDMSVIIDTDHILAAVALMNYARKSTELIFGDTTGDPIADTILDALSEATGGLSKTEINKDVFNKNKTSAQISAALELLISQKKVQAYKHKPAGKRKSINIYKLAEGAE